jgi:hypothetical protein
VELEESGVYTAINMSLPERSDLAGILIVAAPPVRLVETEM